MRADDAWSRIQQIVVKLAEAHPDARFTAIIDTYGRVSIAIDRSSADPITRAAQLAIEAEAKLQPWLAQPKVVHYSGKGRDELLRLALEGQHARLINPSVRNARLVSRALGNEGWRSVLETNPTTWPKVVGFYSFKGGVGRSTAAAISALLMAREGRRILLVDLDLEAPGLEGYFGFRNEQVQGGMVDLLLEQAAMQQRWECHPADFLLAYTADLQVQNRGGLLHVLPAGKLNNSYPERLGRLALADIARTQGQGNPLRVVLQQFLEREAYDVVVVDCRTGFSELGGMTLNGLSDVNVLMFKAAQAERRYIDVVLDHVARLSAASLTDPEQVRRLANSMLFVFSMAQLPAQQRETESFVLELRERVSALLWDRVFGSLAPSGLWNQPDLRADDSYDEPVPHDVVVVPYLRDLPALSSAADMLFSATEGGVTAYQILTRRLLDVKLRLARPDAPRELDLSLSTVSGDVVTALKDLITKVHAEDELAGEQAVTERFLPRAAHRGLLSADVLVIEGDKGAGKSALFMAFQDRELLKQLALYVGVAATQLERLGQTELVAGFDHEAKSALSSAVSSLFMALAEQQDQDQHESLRGFWRALLCARLVERGLTFTEDGDPPLPPLTQTPTLQNARDLALAPERQGELIQWLTEVMRRAREKRRALWVLYDGLDTHLTTRPERRGPLLSALVDLWWDLRGKPVSARIFLRRDLWEREVALIDKAKIVDGTYRMRLEWDGEELYRLLIKRLLKSESFQRLLRERGLWRDDVLPRSGLERLGMVPPADKEWLRQVVIALVGDFMGATDRKGNSYEWIIKHLGDANGRVRPRALLTLFAEAAKLQGADLVGRAPLDQRRLREALRGVVSQMAIDELREEYREAWRTQEVWVPDLFKDFATLWTVDYADLLQWLVKRLTLSPDKVADLLDQMIKSGLLERRTTRSVDKLQVPDIYLFGLGLTRKG